MAVMMLEPTSALTFQLGSTVATIAPKMPKRARTNPKICMPVDAMLLFSLHLSSPAAFTSLQPGTTACLDTGVLLSVVEQLLVSSDAVKTVMTVTVWVPGPLLVSSLDHRLSWRLVSVQYFVVRSLWV